MIYDAVYKEQEATMKLGPYRVDFRPAGLIIPGVFFGFGLYQYLYIRQLPDSDINLVLIRPVFFLMVIFTFWIVVRNVKVQRADDRGRAEPAPPSGGTVNKKKVLAFMGLAALYLGLMPVAGFILCNLIFIPVCMRFLGEKKKTLLILIPVAATAVIVLVFQVWLEIPLPEGVLHFLS
jgi:hypothetical protein